MKSRTSKRDIFTHSKSRELSPLRKHLHPRSFENLFRKCRGPPMRDFRGQLFSKHDVINKYKMAFYFWQRFRPPCHLSGLMRTRTERRVTADYKEQRGIFARVAQKYDVQLRQ
ncbi:uncharacterized protein LOC124947418 [Vespa velutina]|uniref:uncharacterized protein LOC124947418 n=1 Tax=Vespa velutina TaxID=202808 RepID=UPI001FB49A4F|nr:uncharacterized protein LOC124947418 [Vespa velutina]